MRKTRLAAIIAAAAFAGAHARAEPPDKWSAWEPFAEAQSNEAAEQEPPQPSEDAPPPTPAMWVVRDADSTLYLFGTMHVRSTGADLGRAVDRALAEADEVWTELDATAAVSMQTAMLVQRLGYDHERTLESRLNEKDRARLRNLLKESGMPQESVANMRPWLAGMLLSMMPAMRGGFQAEDGADNVITAAAGERGQTRRFFETVEEQMRFFADMPDDEQMQMLRNILVNGGEDADMMAILEGVWAQGDVDRLEFGVVNVMRETDPLTYKTLLAARNWRWMRALVRELDGSGTDFIAVGAAHMVGPDGLVALLRARGYTVTRINPSQFAN